MGRAIGVLAAAVCLVGLAAADAPSELKKLQGEWVMVSAQMNGAPLPPESVRTGRRVCKDDVVTVTLGGQLYFKAKFKVDPSKEPHEIDYDLTEGRGAGTKQHGIYAWDGEKLKFAFGQPGGERPKSFDSAAGGGATVSVWRKADQPAN
jgi:uncharacterized protein (TIGR03067 family)